MILDRVRAGEEVDFGRYELTRSVGSGGMGHVLEAWDRQLERRVALKILKAAHGHEMALREARYLARVTDPHVVSVHEVGRWHGLVFIAMELVDGPDLRAWLREQPRRWPEVLDRIIEAGRGLAAVHAAGLVHGDVKPGNMIVGRDGRVRIADFGLAWPEARAEREPAPRVAAAELATLAKLVAASVDHEFSSQGWAHEDEDAGEGEGEDAGEDADEVPRPVGGTWAYMAPECLEGARAHHVRADLYSLCATAWEALLGARPYAGDDAELVLASIAAGKLDDGRGRPRGMPRAVVEVLRRGLSVDPAARWPSVEALLRELERARARRWWWRWWCPGRPWWVAAALASALASAQTGRSAST